MVFNSIICCVSCPHPSNDKQVGCFQSLSYVSPWNLCEVPHGVYYLEVELLGPGMPAGFVPGAMLECFLCTPTECPIRPHIWYFLIFYWASLLNVLNCTSQVTSEIQHIFVHLDLLFGFLLCGWPCPILTHVYWILRNLFPSIYKTTCNV